MLLNYDWSLVYRICKIEKLLRLRCMIGRDIYVLIMIFSVFIPRVRVGNGRTPKNVLNTCNEEDYITPLKQILGTSNTMLMLIHH